MLTECEAESKSIFWMRTFVSCL